MTPSSDERESTPLKAWVRALEMTAPIIRSPEITLPLLVEGLADRFGTAVALASEDQSLTYRELAKRSNVYALWAKRQGIGSGDVVCLISPNCPDYIAIWLGITRIGAVVALINTNLIGKSLAHSINIVAPKHIIVDAELAEAVAALRPHLSPNLRYWVRRDSSDGFQRIDNEIDNHPGDRLDVAADFPAPSITDCALYIFTSGTTGLPKAARVSHFRLMQWSHWFAGMMDTRSSDRMYNCLPMYHSVGGVVAIGAMLIGGGTVVLRRRFSAKRFWEDVVESRCTIFQYIGELCRYLVSSPTDRWEVGHQLRLCCGNGLRADVWEKFKSRFEIPQILEFYAATESNFSLYNCEGKPGAIGRIPSFLAHRLPVALIKVDSETAEPRRSETGVCLRCAPNEVGEAIGKIPDANASEGSRFEGYTDKGASERKVLRNVFEDGDAWYRTGDLMRKDQKGFFYFVDRLGDTFRWKGENVSTAEVAETILRCHGVDDAVVYGVTVPGTEGRAGMAAIVAGKEFTLAAFGAHVSEFLPEYARPLFLRIRSEIAMTETFKAKKSDLANEGFDPVTITDAVYFYDRSIASFVRLDAPLYDGILKLNVRL